MKANLNGLIKAELKNLAASQSLNRDIYLFLPKNQRMVLLVKSGAEITPQLVEQLGRNGSAEIWLGPEIATSTVANDIATSAIGTPNAGGAASTPTPNATDSPVAEAVNPALAESAVISEKEAADLREKADQLVGPTARLDPLLEAILHFREERDPRSHSVLVGSLSVALAKASQQANEELVHSLLIASTFHDLALPMGVEDHAAESAKLLEESEEDFSKVRRAIALHHSGESAKPLHRYLRLAEYVTNLPSVTFGPEVDVGNLPDLNADEKAILKQWQMSAAIV